MTTAPPAPTKAELLDALRTSGLRVTEKVRAMPAADLEQGRYENGWNAREILAHIASIEWTYPKLIDIARDAASPAAASPPPPQQPSSATPAQASPPARTAQGGILSYNDRQVAKRADASVAELLAEFEQNRAATIAAVESADEALFDKEIRSAGGVTGPLAAVINAVAVLHVIAHTNDIVGARS